MQGDDSLPVVDSRAATNPYLTELRDLCVQLNWYANLLRKCWESPGVQIETDLSRENIPATADLLQQWLQQYRPRLQELSEWWSAKIPHYHDPRRETPSALAPWTSHLLGKLDKAVAVTADSESKASSLAELILLLSQRLHLAASDPMRALQSDEALRFEHKANMAAIEESVERAKQWPEAKVPNYGEYAERYGTETSSEDDLELTGGLDIGGANGEGDQHDDPEAPYDARDQWIYEQALKGTAYATIGRRLPTQEGKSWGKLTDSGVRSVIVRYCERTGKPKPKPRKSGRLPSSNSQ